MLVPEGVTLLPGMSASVALTYRRASILGGKILVPVSAVHKESSGTQLVWGISPEGTVRRLPVQLGAATGGKLEIKEGLQPGDRIAVAGVNFLRENMKVRDLGDALGGGQP
jgi:multidrug efflux pump subunit AcrA (membrane-fusion protein)